MSSAERQLNPFALCSSPNTTSTLSRQEQIPSSRVPEAQVPVTGHHFKGFSYHTTFLLPCPAMRTSRSPSLSISMVRVS